MSERALVTFATSCGSTGEVAGAIGEVLRDEGLQVDVVSIREVKEIESYCLVIVGGPMLSGWHPEARKFLLSHQEVLRKVPVACFMMALNLTRYPEETYAGVNIFQDPHLVKEAADTKQRSSRESTFSVEKYLGPVLQQAPQIKPVSVGFFAGKLDFNHLNPVKQLLVKLFISSQPGDFRNWEAIQTWAESLKTQVSRRTGVTAEPILLPV